MRLRNQKRAGFTLVELMVVIGIIVVLVSLLMAGFSAVRIAQQQKATEDIVRKVQIAIEDQRKELVTQAAKERKERTTLFTSLVGFCDKDEDRAEALLLYLKLRHAFPQTYAEATTNVGLVNWAPHKAYAALPNLSTWPAHEQSAAILFAGMSNMAAGGALFATDDATSGNQVDYTAGSGVTARVFRDARGNPIGFKRFWQSTELDTNPKYGNLKEAFRDPFDVRGRLATLSGNWTQTQKDQAALAVFVQGNNQTFDNRNKSITAYSLGQNKVDENLGGDDVLGYRLFQLGNKGSAQ